MTPKTHDNGRPTDQDRPPGEARPTEQDRPSEQGLPQGHARPTRRWPDLPAYWERIFDEAERLSALVGRVLQDTSRLGPAQYQLLAQLEGQGPMTLTQLSRALGCTRGNITGVTDRLLGQGLIKREPNPGDARSSLISLTPDGAGRLDEARRALQALAAGEGANGLVSPVPGQYIILSANRRPGTGRQEFILLGSDEPSSPEAAGPEGPGTEERPDAEPPGTDEQPDS